MINLKRILGLEYYVSELDQYLKHYDKTHPQLSTSQKREKNKFARIFLMRDKPVPEIKPKSFWDKF